MTAILVIESEDERKKVKDFFKGLEFDYTILNSPESVEKVEGLRFTQVWFTPDVLIYGMDYALFDRLYSTLISMSISPKKGFRLLG